MVAWFSFPNCVGNNFPNGTFPTAGYMNAQFSLWGRKQAYMEFKQVPYRVEIMCTKPD